MTTRVQVQANPALDKPSSRLALAGAGAIGPILSGLAGTINLEIERDEILESAKIYSDSFLRQLLPLGAYTNLPNGRRRWSVDIVYGIDTDYGVAGGEAVRNFIDWTIRKRGVVNPSGPPTGEKFLSKDDEDAIRNLSDAQLRRNRPFFTPRDYAVTETGSVASQLSEASGLTWRDDNATLYAVSDDRRIAVYNREMDNIQGVINLPASIFNDTEAIVYLGSDRFAVLDEGVTGSRVPKLHLFHLKFGQNTVDTTNLVTYMLSDIEEFAGGEGAEGLAYDEVSGLFYVGTQPTGDGEGGLWEVDIGNKNTDGEPTQTLLYTWFDKLVDPGHLDAGALLGDLFYSYRMTGGQTRRSIFCHFRTPDGGGASGMRRVIQVDIESGLYVDDYLHDLDGKWEGFTASPDLEDLFFVREGGGQNIQRHEHTQNEVLQVFRRQFWVKAVPTVRALYINGQEAQQGEAWIWVNKIDADSYALDASMGINILPTFNDEFFSQHEYAGNLGQQVGNQFFVRVDGTPTLFHDVGKRPPNRFAQTLRNIGGVKTVEVFKDADVIPTIAEILIEDLGGLYWVNPSYGLHTIKVRLRAEFASASYIDITGYIRVRQFECPEE